MIEETHQFLSHKVMIIVLIVVTLNFSYLIVCCFFFNK